MNETEYFLNTKREKQDALASYQGKFEKWPELFPDEAQWWPELPAKRQQAERDLKESETTLKTFMPIIAEQRKIDLADVGRYVSEYKIRERSREVDNMRASLGNVRHAMETMDALDIYAIVKLDRQERGVIYRDLIVGLRECFAKAQRLSELVEQNQSDIAEAAKSDRYNRGQAGKIELRLVRTGVYIAPVSREPKVDSDFDPAASIVNFHGRTDSQLI